MVSSRKLKGVLMASAVFAIGGIGSSQEPKIPDVTPPVLELPKIDVIPVGAAPPALPVPAAVTIPPVPADPVRTAALRTRYLERQEELAKHKATLHVELSLHMTAQQLDAATVTVQAEITATMQQSQKAVRERNARQELNRVSEGLRTVAREHKGTEAGAKAQAAIDAIDKPTATKK